VDISTKALVAARWMGECPERQTATQARPPASVSTRRDPTTIFKSPIPRSLAPPYLLGADPVHHIVKPRT